MTLEKNNIKLSTDGSANGHDGNWVLRFSLHGLWLTFSSRGVSYSTKPLEFNYTVNVTKRLVYSL